METVLTKPGLGMRRRSSQGREEEEEEAEYWGSF